MKRTTKLIDKENNKFFIEIEIKNGRLSIVGDGKGSSGQCLDSISPATPAQERLLYVWNKYHLNDMHAGTEKQEAFLKNLEPKPEGYDERCKALEENGLLFDTLPDGSEYKYGSARLKQDLPTDLDIEGLVDELNKEYERTPIQGYEDLTPENKIWLDNEYEYPDAVMALAINSELTVDELLSGAIEENLGHSYTVQGTDYRAGTDSQMDEIWVEELENYVDEYVLHEVPEHLRSYFDREEFINDAMRYDSRGDTLNRWNGGEDTVDVDGETIYIYRQ